MKNYIAILSLLISFSAFGQGNSFTIRVHNKTHLKEWNEYSQKHLFSINDNEISKVELNLYLNCPDSGCSNWDFSVGVLLRKAHNGDTVNYQLGRMITPYSGAYNQGENAKKWNPKWTWDITAYLPLLNDSVDIVMVYEGFEDGFLASTDFVFTKDKDKNQSIAVENIHYGQFRYGNINDPIDNYVTPKEIIIPKWTKRVYARVTISGHGADSTNASAEFLAKDYYYMVNGERIHTQTIWRDDCGLNPIQPQGGTWIYNRAGWCPGTKVNEFLYDITPYISNGKAVVDIDFEYYKTSQTSQPYYHIAHDIFYMQKDMDVYPIEEVIEEEMHTLTPTFMLSYKTNNQSSRNKVYIIDQKTMNKVYERTQLKDNTEYNEIIELEKGGQYRLLFTDSDCNGLSWWAEREQGNGYIYIYNLEKTKLIESFEPDFGCEINYLFQAQENSKEIIHKKSKLIKVPDTKNKTYTFIVFLKDGVEEELVLEIKDRKTKEIIISQTHKKSDRFNIVFDYSILKKGSYEASVKTNSFSETRAFSIRE